MSHFAILVSMTTASQAKIKNDLILRAANCEKVERPPVWMMRQAGRYLPEYMAIREKMSFLELCKDPKKAAEVSIQPLEIIGVDAIIMFSDILIPLEPMGAPVSFATGSPKFGDPIRSKEQVDKLIIPDVRSKCHFVYDTIHEIKNQITKDGVQEVPVLGFAGAPWTLASYLIEGGGSQHYVEIKRFMYQETDAMHMLLEKLSDTVADYLLAKAENGADMLQLFDTWASQLGQKDYQEFALPYQQKIIAKVKAKFPNIKFTLYVNGVANIFDYMIQSGADVLSVDWRANLGEIRSYVSGVSEDSFIAESAEEILNSKAFANGQISKPKVAIQGNFDPAALLGTKESVVEKTLDMLVLAGTEPGYIANLGHGILPSVPVENARAFVQTIKNFRY